MQKITDATGKELSPADIRAVFDREYVAATMPLRYLGHRAQHNASDGTVEQLTAHLAVDGIEWRLHGAGNGPVDAFVHALRHDGGFDIHVQNYHEHAVGAGEDATAVAYVQLRIGPSDRLRCRTRCEHRDGHAACGGECHQSRHRPRDAGATRGATGDATLDRRGRRATGGSRKGHAAPQQKMG